MDALGPGTATGTVLEIGPGKAAITALLAARAQRLVALELDGALAAGLRTRFAGNPAVEILEADVLRVDITALAHGAPQSLLVIGNLPYYITSPILRHLFLHEAVVARAVVMVQREVAERITARPGTRDYGLLSALCQIHAEPELLFTLPPAAFSPPPAVESAVVRMHFASRWKALGLYREPFTRFLATCFAQKRKTLANNLRAAGWGVEPIGAALAKCGAPAGVRAEELGPPELACVFRALGA